MVLLHSPSSSSEEGGDVQSKFKRLPIHSLKSKIVEKILENRVTLIIGETGCGKSSQVPQFLLEENMGPILCTQPRRFAVVAVARMVAAARGCEVGGEVGYHIGHSKVLSSSSKIVFKTAGVLLDEMREKGLKALKYKVIILDEVHERSVESDLVLVCVKQFLLKQNDMRVVLMSATADIARYREYFKDLGKDERVEVLAIPSSPQHTIHQQRVSYLEQVTELLEIRPESFSLKFDHHPLFAETVIKHEERVLIHDLVIHIHKNEPDMEKSILVFLPTYNDLEQLWFLLKRFPTAFKIHILHSSIDTEQALRAMKIWQSHRKVILATNIAESSVTIPKVAYVIDSCRSLQVCWDNVRKKEVPDLVWVSKSQADQRKGRTGRTCDGHVYRLVTGSFYNLLEDYESPSILRMSLRQQVLSLCCAESKAINDPKVLLQKALDPPDPEVVKDALDLLVSIRALEKIPPRGRYEPTFYGRLLASFSLSFDASRIILKFGGIGLMRDGILLGILMDTQPLPILRPFGQNNLSTKYTASYYSGDSTETGLTGKKEEALVGNFAAYQFWQHVFKDKYRFEHLQDLLLSDETEKEKNLQSVTEENWCSFHHLVLSSLNHVAEIYDDVLNTLHRFRPNFLVKSGGLPSYYDPYEFQHACHLKCEHIELDGDVLDIYEDEHRDTVSKVQICTNEPFAVANSLPLDDVAVNLASIIKEIRSIQFVKEISSDQLNLNKYDSALESGEAYLCRYFLSGNCNRGDQCIFSHSLQAKKAACKFFFSLQGCRNGSSCYFSHDIEINHSSHNGLSLCLPEEEVTDFSTLLHLFPTSSDERILILDDTDFRFSSNIARFYNPSSIICTTSSAGGSVSDPSLMGIKILSNLSHPYQTLLNKEGESYIPWNQVKCVLWFPFSDGCRGDLEAEKRVVQTFFEYLAIRILADALFEVQVILTMNNIRFSQLQTEKLGRESFFLLKESFPYNESRFGVLSLSDTVPVKRPMLVSKAVSYVFCLHPPSSIEFDSSTPVLFQPLNFIP
ncbi:hypothetical protein DCAR_0102964 [Daucus carota subsp. sativus]|uniref:RNA helicase n=1 Tax=Daucus carota subsp. sativus TaxID=79200 RepID=A0AAF0W7U0_DAUCS|nr:PREDICTED: DExH-box ATP-dependent RNA helicase DExH8 [Daucus carota subsp. sativus]WOG83786.1 hypothetical protein DCAR_0102964 [Daucus carota subsp. sativus]